jgi:cell division protein FtsB
VSGPSFNLHRYWIDQLRKTQRDMEGQIERLTARNETLAAERDSLRYEVDSLRYRLQCVQREDQDKTRAT